MGASHPATWVIGGPGRAPVDALLTLAAQDEATLRRRVLRGRQAVAGAGLVILHDSTAIAAGEFLLGLAGERRPMALGQRPPAAAWMWSGSFQVFRRLRQDVAGWWDKMEQLRGPGETAEEVAARAMGRKLDGTSLAPTGTDFAGDPAGAHTPLYSHVRKMNPRQDEVFRDRSHRILRRGIPYGPVMDRARPDDADRGLLFNAYMASIEDQFEFLQRRWANDPQIASRTLGKFGKKGAGADGFDPVIGDGPEVAGRRFGKDVVKGVPALAFGGFVTTTGSVYAFTPTRATLHLLSSNKGL